MPSPLFALRRRRWFQRITIALDRQIRVRVAGLSFPITMRLGPNLSLVVGRRDADYLAFGRLLAASPPRCFWDVGANVGLYGFLFAPRYPGRPCRTRRAAARLRSPRGCCQSESTAAALGSVQGNRRNACLLKARACQIQSLRLNARTATGTGSARPRRWSLASSG
jgi:hypothetical protein